MQIRYIPAFIVLLAAAITSIINIVNNVDLLTAFKRLLLVIIVFYVIGLIAKAIINKAIKPKPKDEDAEQAQEESSESE